MQTSFKFYQTLITIYLNRLRMRILITVSMKNYHVATS